MRRRHQGQNHRHLMPGVFRRAAWITGDTLRPGENRLSQSRHVRKTHYPASRSQCFASTSRNTTPLHTMSSTTQKPTLAKANACQLARVQATFIRVLLELPSHRKPLSQHKITLMLPVRVTRGDEVCGYKLIGLYFLESLRLDHITASLCVNRIQQVSAD